MEEYLNQFIVIADQLALVSSPVDDEDLILLILNCLPDEYNALKTTVRARSGPISIEQLCSLFCFESIHVETSLKHMHAVEAPGLFAYNTHRGNFSNRGGHRGNYRGRGNFRGRDGGRFRGGPAQQSGYSQRGNSFSTF